MFLENMGISPDWYGRVLARILLSPIWNISELPEMLLMPRGSVLEGERALLSPRAVCSGVDFTILTCFYLFILSLFKNFDLVTN